MTVPVEIQSVSDTDVAHQNPIGGTSSEDSHGGGGEGQLVQDDDLYDCESGDSRRRPLVNEEGNEEGSNFQSSPSKIGVIKTDESFLSDSDMTCEGEVVAPSSEDETMMIKENAEETKEQAEEEEVMIEEEDWPQAFYCQRSHVLMTDPLVDPSGLSIDRSAVDKNDLTTLYYPNRALQAIVQESLTLKKHPFKTGLEQLQQSLSQGLSIMSPPEVNVNEPPCAARPLNDAFYCPITCNLMHHPVIDPEGNTFEREAVEKWIRNNQTSPISRTTLRIDQLYPNRALEQLLHEEKERPEDQMHPAIKKWKEEQASTATEIEMGDSAAGVRAHEQQGMSAYLRESICIFLQLFLFFTLLIHFTPQYLAGYFVCLWVILFIITRRIIFLVLIFVTLYVLHRLTSDSPTDA